MDRAQIHGLKAMVLLLITPLASKAGHTASSIWCESQGTVFVSIGFAESPWADLYDVEVALVQGEGDDTNEPQSRPFLSVTSVSSPVEIIDLQPNATYRFWVRGHSKDAAMESYGWGGLSDPVLCRTKDLNICSPRSLKRRGSLQMDSIGLAWSPPPPLEAGNADYNFVIEYRREGGSERVSSLTVGNATHATIEGLQLATTYRVRVGLKGGGADAWSDEVPFSTGRKNVKYLEVFRISERGGLLPDFLENHDSADARGEVMFLSSCMCEDCDCSRFFNMTRSPFTRYCVEVLDVSIPNTNTTNGSSAFSDYLGCENQGNDTSPACGCDLWFDRVLAHQPQHVLDSFCPPNASHTTPHQARDCYCDPDSLRISNTFTGMMPVPLPNAAPIAKGTSPEFSPGHYPYSKPFSYWFHHPSDGFCRIHKRKNNGEEAQVFGKGCSWSRFPSSYIVYWPELLQNGWDETSPKKGLFMPDEQVERNAEVFEATMATRAQRCCGC